MSRCYICNKQLDPTQVGVYDKFGPKPCTTCQIVIQGNLDAITPSEEARWDYSTGDEKSDIQY
jgi:hypothetical protein